jgi:hypothetical protein
MTQQPLNFRNKPLADELKEFEHLRQLKAAKSRLFAKGDTQAAWRILGTIKVYEQQQQEVDRARSY